MDPEPALQTNPRLLILPLELEKEQKGCLQTQNSSTEGETAQENPENKCGNLLEQTKKVVLLQTKNFPLKL